MDSNEKKQDTMDFVLEKSTTGNEPAQTEVNSNLNIPTVFCANHELAKALLVDIFALIGTLRGIGEGQVDKQMIPKILSNSQSILAVLGDLLIRDCHLTDKDLEEVMRVFEVQASSENTKVTHLPKK